MSAHGLWSLPRGGRGEDRVRVRPGGIPLPAVPQSGRCRKGSSVAPQAAQPAVGHRGRATGTLPTSLRSAPLLAGVQARAMIGVIPRGGADDCTITWAGIRCCRGDSDIDCPNFVAEPDHGEGLVLGDPAAQSLLYDDAQVLMEYGGQHEDVYGGLRFANSPYVRLEVGFTADVNEHCWAMRELVEFTDDFEVVRVPLSIQDKRAAARAAEEAGGLVYGVDWNPVKVIFPPDGEAVAEQFHGQYGAALNLWVGGWPYPPPDDGEIPGVCEPVVESTDLLPLTATIADPGDPVGVTEERQITITVQNHGTEHLRFAAGKQALPLFRPGETAPAAVYSGFIEDSALIMDLEPGETAEIGGAIGITPCTLDHGYLLEAGGYELRGPFEYSWEDQWYVMLLDPVPVTVTG